MDLIRKIIQEAGTYLKQDGALILEIGNEAAHFLAVFPQIPVTWLPVSAGDDQVLLIRKEDL